MNRFSRHRINALICLIVVLHAVYAFASGHLDAASPARVGLAVAEFVVGLFGVFWFWRRAKRTDAKSARSAGSE